MKKTKSMIKEALPNIELDENTSYLADDLDKLSVLATFKGSALGEEYLRSVEVMCAQKIDYILQNHRNMRDSIHEYLSEVNILMTLTKNLYKSSKEADDLQAEVDRRLEATIEATRRVSRGANAGL